MDLLHSTCRRLAPAVLAVFGLVTLYVPAVQAGMISTPGYAQPEAGASTPASSAQQRQELERFLQRDDVQERLTALGVDPTEAQARVQRMTDQELAQVAQQMEQLPAGGDSVIGAIVLIFLVLLLTDILGFTNIFPFVKKTAR